MENFAIRVFVHIIILMLVISNISQSNNLLAQSNEIKVVEKIFVCRTPNPKSRISLQNLRLELGESITLPKCGITCTFTDVLEFTVDNLAVYVEVECDNWNRSIELNSNKAPSSYTFPKGIDYKVHLKNVELTPEGYHVVLAFVK